MKPIGIFTSLMVFSVALQAGNVGALVKSKQNFPFETVSVKNLKTGTTQLFENVDKVPFALKSQDLDSPISLETQVYPNPAMDVVNIHFFNPSEGKVSIEVYTTTGQLLTCAACVLSQGRQLALLTGVPSGIAIIRVTNGNQVTSSKLVISTEKQSMPSITFVGSADVERQKSGDVNSVEYTEGDRFLVTATQNGQTHSFSYAPYTDAIVEIDFPVCSDGNGNQYHTVQIGTQVWMAQNLRTTAFSDGEEILNVVNKQAWRKLSSAACAAYENNYEKSTQFGLLYNGFAAVDERNVCPVGWRVPSDDDWAVLQQYMDDNQYSTSAGNMLIAESEWQKSGHDVFGFGAVPAGLRYAHNGEFGHAGIHGRWWTSTKSESGKIWNRYINSDKDFLGRGEYNPVYGYSIRCVKD